MENFSDSRRNLLIFGASSMALVACGGGTKEVTVTKEEFKVNLAGDQEVPRALTGANGKASFYLDRAARKLSGSVQVSDMVPTLAHIHLGAAGSSGSVVTALVIGSGGQITLPEWALTAEQMSQLDGGNLYVNVHSAAFAAGEIRGQLLREVYASSLTGLQEVASVVTSATGSGYVSLNPDTGVINGFIRVTGITVTSAHIHRGGTGVNGVVAVALESTSTPGLLNIPANTKLSTDDIAALRSGNLYFNAHSAAYTAGEIRGQIGVWVIAATATGAQESPSVTTLATGKAWVTLNPMTRLIKGQFQVADITPTLAHIHTGAINANGGVTVGLEAVTATPGLYQVPAATPALTATQATTLLNSGMYVNAHSAIAPNGEVRGQLINQ